MFPIEIRNYNPSQNFDMYIASLEQGKNTPRGSRVDGPM